MRAGRPVAVVPLLCGCKRLPERISVGGGRGVQEPPQAEDLLDRVGVAHAPEASMVEVLVRVAVVVEKEVAATLRVLIGLDGATVVEGEGVHPHEATAQLKRDEPLER